MTIFHLLAGIVTAVGIMQGRKADVFGITIGSTVGVVAALLFLLWVDKTDIWFAKLFRVTPISWPEIEIDDPKVKLRSTVCGYTTMLVWLIGFILCCFCSYYFTQLLVTALLGEG